MKRGDGRAARRRAHGVLVAASLAVALGGCKRPVVGAPTTPSGGDGPCVEITAATVNGTGHVVVSLRLGRDAVPVASVEDAAALHPQFTVAALSPHPVDGIAAWRSLLLTGDETLPQLPPGGPGTPPAQVLANARQPGAEANGTLAGADGEFTYEFANALPASFDPTETLRVGAWLVGTATPAGTSTLDFRPAGGTPAPRDVVLSSSCDACHGAVRSTHGGVGVKICTTCHTWQNADPDTVDPAAAYPGSSGVNPNPLELGRLVHRIHRGKNLPTLYKAGPGGNVVPAPALPAASPPPLPFFPSRNNPFPPSASIGPIAGRKYAIVGRLREERVFGEIVVRHENGLAMTVPSGVVFPRDLRDCGVCHAGAPQAYEILYAISRRTCSGCHPETWFDSAPIAAADLARFAHTGGPQADDGECRGCHVAPTAAHPKVYAPIAEIHVQPHHAPSWDRPVAKLVEVTGVRKGEKPVVRFRMDDRMGSVTPIAGPTIPYDTTSPFPNPVPRTMSYYSGGWLGITVNGPTEPGFGPDALLSELSPNPSYLTLAADASGVFTYAFAQTVPDTATGTWAVGLEARRSAAVPFYDPASDRFLWPYTGESLSETPVNPVVYVSTATGTYTEGVVDPAVVPRRTVVKQEKCERCHDPIEVHGTTRFRVEYCLVCHSPQKTDWGVRPKGTDGNTNLAGTLDGIEERSIDFKVMIHRIHTGASRGAATLEGIEPHVVYGRYGTIWFFDEGVFPADLGNCTLCHEGKTYTVEAVPADAPPTIANETATVMHAATAAHVPGEPTWGPIQAACLGCHASSATMDHARRNTLDGVEQCASCHARGATSVDVAHGLARPSANLVSASFRSIAENILVPRCASAACHGGNPPAAFPRLDLDAAYQAIVGVASQQVSGMKLVEPYQPEASYLLLKMRGDAGSVGGVATPMPIGDAALDPSDVAAIEGWIANGAPND